MFGFGKRKPNPTALYLRGEWLSIALLKASGGDLQLLMKTIGLREIPKNIQNKIRLEMAIFLLSKSEEIIKPLIQEKLLKSEATSVQLATKDFLRGAWQIFKDIFPQEKSNIQNAQASYQCDDDKIFILWKRLREIGIDVDENKNKYHLSVFERTVLQGTFTTLTLDAITTPQTQIRHDHESFSK